MGWQMHHFFQLTQRFAPRAEVHLLRVDRLMIDIAVDPGGLKLDAGFRLPLLNQPFRPQWQNDPGWRLEPARLVDERKHNSRDVRTIRHAGMPQSDIPDDEASLLRRGLYWRRMLSSVFEKLRSDHKACFATGECTLLIDVAIFMAADPELGTTVLDAHIAQGNVESKSERP